MYISPWFIFILSIASGLPLVGSSTNLLNEWMNEMEIGTSKSCSHRGSINDDNDGDDDDY